MKTSKPVLVDSILAAANLTAYRFAGYDGNHCGANAKARGIIQQDTAQGAYAPITVLGIDVVETGGVFSAGDPLASDSQGRAVKASDVSVSSVLTIETTASIPSGETPVTSTSANPALTASSTGSAVNTVAGGALPVAINGHAQEASTGAGKFVRVNFR